MNANDVDYVIKYYQLPYLVLVGHNNTVRVHSNLTTISVVGLADSMLKTYALMLKRLKWQL